MATKYVYRPQQTAVRNNMAVVNDEGKEKRRRMVAMAVALTANTKLAPQRYERQLLDRYRRGELTIDHVISLLDNSVYQVLYQSNAVHPMTEPELRAMLLQARGYNAQHHLTGILLYSDGRFVQLLEGEEQAVRQLYSKIQRDPRHIQVVTVSEGPGPGRRFADWNMGFGRVAGPKVAEALNVLLSQELVPTPEVAEPYLLALLHAFGIQLPPNQLK